MAYRMACSCSLQAACMLGRVTSCLHVSMCSDPPPCHDRPPPTHTHLDIVVSFHVQHDRFQKMLGQVCPASLRGSGGAGILPLWAPIAREGDGPIAQRGVRAHLGAP